MAALRFRSSAWNRPGARVESEISGGGSRRGSSRSRMRPRRCACGRRGGDRDVIGRRMMDVVPYTRAGKAGTTRLMPRAACAHGPTTRSCWKTGASASWCPSTSRPRWSSTGGGRGEAHRLGPDHRAQRARRGGRRATLERRLEGRFRSTGLTTRPDDQGP